jgi:hypothetical protein
MAEQLHEAIETPELCDMPRLIAYPLTCWFLLFVGVNCVNYIRLTWQMFVDLRWASLMLLVSPCSWIWFGVFSYAAFVPLKFYNFLWLK